MNVIAILLQTYNNIDTKYSSFFKAFEIFSIVVFTVEYIFRFWACDVDDKYAGTKFVKKLKFFFSIYGLIDLFAILPFYLPFIFLIDLRFIRILRVFRLFRVFKISRYSKSLKLISSVLKEAKEELFVSIFIVFILMVFSATLMFYIENDAQPEKFQNIGDAFWWAIATLTTVGYGDIYPITSYGKFLSAIIALLGIGFVALPTGIISSEFIRRVQNNKTFKNNDCKCPKCGTTFPANSDE